MLKTCWPAVPIEYLCARVTSGGTPSRSNPAYYEGGTIPWIKTGELRGWYVDDIAERITPAAVRESSAKVFPPETVLLAMYGDGKTMGSVGLAQLCHFPRDFGFCGLQVVVGIGFQSGEEM